jgi:hypothetical protein
MICNWRAGRPRPATTDFHDVAKVIAVARIAGVDRVGLMTEDGKHLPMTG